MNARAATAGEALIDLVTQADGHLLPCLGGAVYNLTRALSRQAVSTSYLNPFSQDRFGQMLAKQLEADGAHIAQSDRVVQPTALSIVSVDSAGEPHYAFYREGVADRATSATTLIAVTQSLNKLEIVATGCLALAPEDQAIYQVWLQSCRKAGLGIALDMNLRPAIIASVRAYRASVLLAMTNADLIKASDEDLNFLFDQTTDPLVAAQAIFEISPARWIALTLGAEGAYLLARDGRAWHGLDHAAMKIVDTVGAGDCFLAGLLAALLGENRAASVALNADSLLVSEQRAKEALCRALASASFCIQRPGCEPPNSQQVQAHLSQHTIKLQAFASGQTPFH